jgi:hypothetical protein
LTIEKDYPGFAVIWTGGTLRCSSLISLSLAETGGGKGCSHPSLARIPMAVS